MMIVIIAETLILFNKPAFFFPISGTLDNDTVVMMNTPRCGVKDKIGHSNSARRKKRYALQGKLF